MKTLFKILLALCLLSVVFLAIAYFAVTRPSLQKRLLQAQLPEGSTVEYVHVLPSKMELRGVDVQMPDGSRLQVGRIQAGFSPLAAVFDQTIRLSGVEVEALAVEVPKAPEGAVGPARADSADGERTTTPPKIKSKPATDTRTSAGAPTDALYALGRLEWLLDIDSIDLQGEIIDAYENRFVFRVGSGAIAPGVETDLKASLVLASNEALRGGLQNFTSEVAVRFRQNPTGGFESLSVDSNSAGSDASGASLLTASQTFTLEVDVSGESAALTFAANADLPDPGAFLPELRSMPGLSLQAELTAKAAASVLTLTEAKFDASAQGQPIAKVNLEQALTLGAEQQFAGRLMTAEWIRLPLAWVNPWLGNGLELSGAPFSANILLSGGSDGTLEVSTEQPLEWGPISLRQDGEAVLEAVTLRMQPNIRVGPDQSVEFDLRAFELGDPSGALISGDLSGQKYPAREDALFGGLQSEAVIDVGLAELLQQPLFAGRFGVLAGRASLRVTIDETVEYPAQIEASVAGLGARSQPGSRQDYRLASQLKQIDGGAYALGANLQAGLESGPSTTVQLAGQVVPDRSPIPFQMDLASTAILQSDLDILVAALTPGGSEQTSRPTETVPSPRPVSPPSAADDADPAADTVVRPPWAALDGSVDVQIDQFSLNSGQAIRAITAQAIVSEALLELRQIEAGLQDGQIMGRAKVAFDSDQSNPYSLTGGLSFKDVDPAFFSQNRSGRFPVSGVFDGDFQLSGTGATLEGALENSEASLLITGRDGLLTAFELDNRSQLGLLGVGLLGQQLERPGLTAMAQAVPYFKDMRFENFTLNLTRGKDKVVRIPELAFLGEDIRIEGQGLIAASRLDEVLDQPLQLSLAFGAKGRLVDYLETLRLLGTQTGPDGFRNWSQTVAISGTLADPDTSALKDLLSEAASRAVLGGSAGKIPAPAAESAQSNLTERGDAAEQAPAEKTKRERRRDDIEMGLDLLNSVLGN